MVTIQLAKNLDHIGIRIRATKGIPRAIETKDELLRLRRVIVLSVRHREVSETKRIKI
jgi:hypothetical protein